MRLSGLRIGCAAAGLGLVLTACGPTVEADVDYRSVDAEFLSNTRVVVATSRANTTLGKMKGSTLFVDHTGQLSKASNYGMDVVHLAYDGNLIGFSDLRHDYLLGSDEPVRERKEVPELNYGSFLIDHQLVSLFNGGTDGDSYELTISDTGANPSVSRDEGFVRGLTQCDDGVWIVRPPGAAFPENGPGVQIDRIKPLGAPTWTVTASGDIDVTDAVCDGTNLMTLGTVGEGNSSWHLTTTDLNDGTSKELRLTGAIDDTPDTHFVAVTSADQQLYVVAIIMEETGDSYQLLRIDPVTGESVKIADYKETSDQTTLFRFQDEVLYMLDSTWDSPSVLRALSLEDGRTLDTFEFDAIERAVNSASTTFDFKQFTRDFVVLTPVQNW